MRGCRINIFRFPYPLTPHINKDSLSWTLGSSLEGDGREKSRTLMHPRWSSLRMRESRKNNTAFIGALTPRQNKESLPWTLGPSPRMTWNGLSAIAENGLFALDARSGSGMTREGKGCPIGVGHDGRGITAGERSPPPLTPPRAIIPQGALIQQNLNLSLQCPDARFVQKKPVT